MCNVSLFCNCLAHAWVFHVVTLCLDKRSLCSPCTGGHDAVVALMRSFCCAQLIGQCHTSLCDYRQASACHCSRVASAAPSVAVISIWALCHAIRCPPGPRVSRWSAFAMFLALGAWAMPCLLDAYMRICARLVYMRNCDTRHALAAITLWRSRAAFAVRTYADLCCFEGTYSTLCVQYA